MNVQPVARAAAPLNPKNSPLPFQPPIRPILHDLVDAIFLWPPLAKNLVRPASIVSEKPKHIHTRRIVPWNQPYLNVELTNLYTHAAILTGCPMLFDSDSANISAFLSIRSANLSITLLRSCAVHLLHEPWNAARAAGTAFSTSASDAICMSSATRDSSPGE
jgi:hypothetical protein